MFAQTNKVIVVGNPAITNAPILNHNTPNIPNINIMILMKLSYCAKSISVHKLSERVENITGMTIWGNHQPLKVIDLYNCRIN